MDTYSVEFYDLLSRALGTTDRYTLQGYLDEVMAAKYNQLQLDGFTFADDMLLDFTYEQVQREVGLNVMAQYVDIDAPAIPLGGQGFTLGTGKIPRMKLVEYLNEDKIRKKLILEQRFGRGSDRVINSAKNDLFTTLDKLIGGHTNSLTYQRHQMVSNRAVVLTDKNNPNGIVNQIFSARVPEDNVTKLTGAARWWTDAKMTKEGTAANPIADMKRIVKIAKRKGIQGHFEVDEEYMDHVLGHSKVVEAIAIDTFVGMDVEKTRLTVAGMADDDKVQKLTKLVGAPIKTIDSIVAVEKWDKTKKKLDTVTFRAFESNVIVFVPDGNIGEVLTVEPISVGGTVSTFYEGRLMLTVGMDPVKKCQSFNTEMTSLVVPDKPQCMYYLHPYSA